MYFHRALHITVGKLDLAVKLLLYQQPWWGAQQKGEAPVHKKRSCSSSRSGSWEYPLTLKVLADLLLESCPRGYL